MKKQLLIGKAILICLLYLTAAQAAPVSANLYGHWLKTDGSNRFVIGIYPNTACYNNETWRIRSAEEVQGRWQLTLEHGDKTALVTVQRKDSVTLLLGDGKQQELKNVRTFNNRYRPEQPAFRQQLFTSGSALIKGMWLRPGKRREFETYVQLSYNDFLTGKKEYFFAELDSLDCFSLHFPMHMPAICTLSVGSPFAGSFSFLVQPDDSVLLALNATVPFNNANPDYDRLLQTISFMGSDAAFNNQYQHYGLYANHWDFNPLKLALSANYNLPAGEKDQQEYALYSKVYDSILHGIDLVYPAHTAEKRFIDFVKAETRYSCLLTLLNGRNQDSTYLQKLYDRYLAQETPLAMLHYNFYLLVRMYAGRLQNSGSHYSFSSTLPIDKVTERVQNDYGVLLSQTFMKRFDVIQENRALINSMKDENVIQKYFNGNGEEAQNFWYILEKITGEFFKEARDSTAYLFYKRAILNVSLRFTASLIHLQGNAWNDNFQPVPSLQRISIFKQYNQLPGMPYREVAVADSADAPVLQAASLKLKPDTQHIRQIDLESQWQAALKTHRGKTVVIWMLAYQFNKERTARNLYELQKLQAYYRSQHVVILKCIQQYPKSEKDVPLLQYLEVLNQQHQLHDVIYINDTVSAGGLKREGVNDCFVIYDSSGQLHNHQHEGNSWQKRDHEVPALSKELDNVLRKK